MKRTFETMAADDEKNEKPESSQPTEGLNQPKTILNKLVLFKISDLDFIWNENLNQYNVLLWPRQNNQEFSYCMALTKLLYNLGAILINKGCAYSGAIELLANGNLKDIFKLEINENFEQAGKLLQLYGAIAPYSNAAKKPRYEVTNSSHALFVFKVALDHLPASFVYALHTKLSPLYSSVPLAGGTVVFPNGESFQTEHAIFWLLSSYIATNSSRFYIDDKEIAKLKNDTSFTIYEIYGTSDSTYALGVNIFSRNLADELAGVVADKRYIPIDGEDLFEEPLLFLTPTLLQIQPQPPVPAPNQPQPLYNIPGPFFALPPLPPPNPGPQLIPNPQQSQSTSSEFEQTLQY